MFGGQTVICLPSCLQGNNNMISYIIKRCLRVIPLLLIVSILMFLVLNLLPGNAVTQILSDMGTVEQKEALEERFGLNLPVPVQYWKWLTSFVQGDMGKSFMTSKPVADKIWERVPVTAEMILLAISLAIVIGVPAGIFCAVRRGKASDYILSTVAVVELSMPQFWIGMLLIMLLAVHLKILPASGFTRFSMDPARNLRSMILPTITLGISLAAAIIRQTRSAMLDAIHQDFVITARSKGLKESKIFAKHALRNALLPVVTAIASQINDMVGGAFVIETLFLLPGMGKMIVDAIYQRDYPVVMAGTMLIVTFIVLVNLLADILNILIDPRISQKTLNS